jgi:hypothetical protein
MGWVTGLGWRPRDWRHAPAASGEGRRVADAARQLAQVLAPDARRARLERGLLDQRRQAQARAAAVAHGATHAGIELYARASEAALAFLAMFRAGRTLSPPGRVTMDERIGKQLFEAFPTYTPIAAEQARRARQA